MAFRLQILTCRRSLSSWNGTFELDPITACRTHGAVRAERGKPPCGRIVIELSPINGSHVELLIADDGAGIDTANVKAAALNLGLPPPEEEEALINKDALPFIFESGVSTSPIKHRAVTLRLIFLRSRAAVSAWQSSKKRCKS